MKGNRLFGFLREMSQVVLLFLGVYSALMCATVRLDILLDRNTVILLLFISSFAIWGLLRFLEDYPYGQWIALAMGTMLLAIFLLRFGAVFAKGLSYAFNSILKRAMIYYNIKLELMTYSDEAAVYSREYSTTVFISVIGVILLFLLSMSFYKGRKASVFFLLTFPFFMFPFFLGHVGFYKEVVIYLMSMIAVYATGQSRCYKMGNKLKGKVSLLMSGIVLLCALLGFWLYPPKRYLGDLEDLIQTKADFKEVMSLSGEEMFGWIRSNLSADAMDYGIVGQRDKVIYNGKKLLEITPSYITNKSLYLKGFVGDKYRNGEWISNHSEQSYKEDLERLKQSTGGSPDTWAEKVVEELKKEDTGVYDSNQDWGLVQESNLQIKNIAMGRKNQVLPYYIKGEPMYDEYGRIRHSGSVRYSLEYYCRLEEAFEAYYSGRQSPKLRDMFSQDSLIKNEQMMQSVSEMTQFANKYYLDLPENMVETLAGFLEFCAMNNIKKESSVMDKIYTVRSFLISSGRYEYTLSPGKTPEGEDSIDYFLNENHKGYCVHFASAATLMLRNLGVPARFVEGVFVDNKRLIRYWNKKETHINVLDEDAHAWVEVFIEEAGFVPLDFTPGRGELGDTLPDEQDDSVEPPPRTPEPTLEPQEDEEDMEFEDIEQDFEEEEDVDGGSNNEENKNNLWLILLCAVAGVFISMHGQWLIRQKLYRSALYKKDAKGGIKMLYFHLKPLLSGYHCSHKGEAARVYIEKIMSSLSMSEEHVRPFVENLMKAEFGEKVTDENLMEFKRSYRRIRKQMIKKASFVKKVIYRYIYNQ